MPKIAPNLASKLVPTSPTSTPPPAPARASPDPKHASSLNPPAASAAAAATATATEPTWLTGLALKAVHEHTFATQRAKKAADRAKGKAPPRKAAAHPSSSLSQANSSASPARTAAMTSIWAEIWDARKMVAADDLEWPELPTPPPPPSLPSQRWTTAECALRPTQDREVPLSALVRPVKVRGAKAKGESEFEVLPPVRNVIALDDADSNVPDEPWEYISSAGGDEEARKIFSYAEIVSKSA